MDAYSQNFQFAAKSFFGCQYCNFENLYLKLGGETLEDIILIIFGGTPCRFGNGLVLANILWCLVMVNPIMVFT